MSSTPPFGLDARYWNFTHSFVTIAAANVAQKCFPRGSGRPVELLCFQAAVANAGLIAIGYGGVTINGCFRQLSAGQAISLNLVDDPPATYGHIGPDAVELVKPRDVVDAAQWFAIAPNAADILIITLGYRQPAGPGGRR